MRVRYGAVWARRAALAHKFQGKRPGFHGRMPSPEKRKAPNDAAISHGNTNRKYKGNLDQNITSLVVNSGVNNALITRWVNKKASWRE